MAKKFEKYAEMKKTLEDPIGLLSDLRIGVIKLRRYAALMGEVGAHDRIVAVFGAAEAADMAAIAAKVTALLADLDKNYPEALGN